MDLPAPVPLQSSTGAHPGEGGGDGVSAAEMATGPGGGQDGG